MRSRTLPLEIVDDHALVRIGDEVALIDTGSWLSLRAPEIVSQQLGRKVRWLVGTDVLERNRVLIDWRGRRVVINGVLPRGERIDLVPVAGVFQVRMDSPQGPAMAYLDSGAALSYAPAGAVRGLVPIGRRKDFYPVVGEFTVDVYRITVRVGSRHITASFGVIPPAVARLLSLLGPCDWILGADFFRDRAIVLDLGDRCVYDAPAESVRPRTTITGRRHHASVGAHVGPSAEGAEERSAIRQVHHPIEGWRAWRLVMMGDDTPRLMSLVADDIWDAPVFVSDGVPALVGAEESTGVHAYSTPAGLASTLLHGPAIVYGQVTLYGRVCVHETGYRAERARIDRLFLRACGLHRRSEHAVAPEKPAGVYCGCPSLTHEEWLSYEALESLAATLSTHYECDVAVDALRVRGGPHSCSANRLFRTAVRGGH